MSIMLTLIENISKNMCFILQRSRIQVWLYEQVNLRVEGCIVVSIRIHVDHPKFVFYVFGEHSQYSQIDWAQLFCLWVILWLPGTVLHEAIIYAILKVYLWVLKQFNPANKFLDSNLTYRIWVQSFLKFENGLIKV